MRSRSLIVPTTAAIVVAIVALALGHSRGRSSGARSTVVASGTAARLTIAHYAFAPSGLTVKVGTTIAVTNADQTAHTATATSGAFDSGTLNPGQSGHVTLARAGTYTYICQFHAFMMGTIKVVN